MLHGHVRVFVLRSVQAYTLMAVSQMQNVTLAVGGVVMCSIKFTG